MQREAADCACVAHSPTRPQALPVTAICLVRARRVSWARIRHGRRVRRLHSQPLARSHPCDLAQAQPAWTHRPGRRNSLTQVSAPPSATATPRVRCEGTYSRIRKRPRSLAPMPLPEPRRPGPGRAKPRAGPGARCKTHSGCRAAEIHLPLSSPAGGCWAFSARAGRPPPTCAFGVHKDGGAEQRRELSCTRRAAHPHRPRWHIRIGLKGQNPKLVATDEYPPLASVRFWLGWRTCKQARRHGWVGG